MRTFVEGRNESVHNFLPRLDLPREGAVTEALAYLEAQRVEGLRLMRIFEGWAYMVEAGKKNLAECMASQGCSNWSSWDPFEARYWS